MKSGNPILAIAAGAVVLALGIHAPNSAWANGEVLAQGEKSKNAQSKAQQNGKKSQGKGQQQTDAQGQGGVPFLVLIPIQQDVDTLGGGCWARFYDGKRFEGDQLTLVGPVDLPNMNFHRRFYWGGLDSAIVGPKATVTIYDDENFRERNATLKPGDHIESLDDQKLGLFEDIESIKITCSQ